jgi:nucleotide-binding universal stress UspA family protein
MYASILVPVDVAHESSWKHALPQAIELARAHGARVTVLTVLRQTSLMFEGVYLAFQLEQLMAAAREKLAQIVAAHDLAGLQVTQDVRMGSIGGEILASIRDTHADLVVMASHRPEMQDYLIGPNAAHVVTNTKASVFVVREPLSAQR